jgi:hypothetical protein
MLCEAIDNRGSVTSVSSTGVRSAAKGMSRPSISTVNVKPEDLIAFQMSLIPEVEQVYVSRPNCGELHVLVIVNDRDRLLNRKIFAKENAIVDYYRHLRFDFHIVPRMNRNLSDVMAVRGTRVFPLSTGAR